MRRGCSRASWPSPLEADAHRIVCWRDRLHHVGMNLHRMLVERGRERRPLRVVLIGAGKFGSMYLAQAKHTAGVHVIAVVDLAPDRARAALARVGWAQERYAAKSLIEAA